MPLLDIPTAQPCFQHTIHAIKSQTLLHANFVDRNEKRLVFPWKSFFFPGKVNIFNLGPHELRRGRLIVNAVVTFEHTKLTQRKEDLKLRIDVDPESSLVTMDEHQSSIPDLVEVNEREKLRRMRISRANKGNTPWNKGRKHSPETLQRIKERTRLAMQDPKVKMKLVNLGHAQSKETRMKIGLGVRLGWEKRREKLMVQETCHYEWQNIIAEAARKGLLGEEELQWNSYKILAEQLEQEWLRSVEERKRMPRPKGSKRAPKSLEQRRKISEAIAAKWSDPVYRTRVYSGLAKYHGIPVGTEIKPRKKPIGDGEMIKRSPSKRKIDSDDLAKPESKNQIQRTRLRQGTVPAYEDPLVSSKLEMLKNIRAQRTAFESKKREAIYRAKVLIADATKAANALEVAAKKSPIAQASLIESRKLIAEAIQSIESIENGEVDIQNNGSTSPASAEMDSLTKDETVAETEELYQIVQRDLNRDQTSTSNIAKIMDSNFEKSSLQELLEDEVHESSFRSFSLINGKDNLYQMTRGDYDVQRLSLANGIKRSSFKEQSGEPPLNGRMEQPNGSAVEGAKFVSNKEDPPPKSASATKKWVRGRLVEVTE